jgi:hypothetical protein
MERGLLCHVTQVKSYERGPAGWSGAIRDWRCLAQVAACRFESGTFQGSLYA